MTTRITIILPDGRVIGDAKENPAGMDNHRNRPEIAAALKGATGTAVRFSNTRRQSLMYLAIPVRQGNTLLAVARVSLPLAVIDWSVHAVVRNIILGWLIVVILFAVVTWLLSRRISRPLEDMRRVAERIARGDLEARVARPDSEELGDLARTLNQMAAQLSERLGTITRQRNEQEAVLASMVEGVFGRWTATNAFCILIMPPHGCSISRPNRRVAAVFRKLCATGTYRPLLVPPSRERVRPKTRSSCMVTKNVSCNCTVQP